MRPLAGVDDKMIWRKSVSVLVLAPQADGGVQGIGGAIASLIDKGAEDRR